MINMQTKKMQEKNKKEQLIKEIKRQVLHFAFGTILILLTIFLGIEKMIIVLITALSIGLVLTTLIGFIKIPIIQKILEKVEREQEKKWKGKGLLTFCSGTLITLLITHVLGVNEIYAITGIIVLSYGDAFSTITGKLFGKTKLTKKITLEGSLGGIIISALILHAFFNPTKAFAIATFGMMAEILPIEDNITIPLFATIMAILIS